MSEEIENAGLIVPKAMVWSCGLNIPLTFLQVIRMAIYCVNSDAL